MNWAIVEQVIIMAILVAVGFFCRKIKMLDEENTKKLSTLVLTFATPMVILTSYQKSFSLDVLGGLLISFALAIVSYIICFVIVPLIVRGKNKDDVSIERFACIYSNCAFMGIPLIEGVYGSDGVFYLTAFYTMFNIFVWTHGVISMKGGGFSLKAFGKSLLSPCIIASVIGLDFFVFGVVLPSPVMAVAKHLSGLNTPLAMIIAGSTIGAVNLKKTFTKPKLYYCCLVKLIILPAIMIAICAIFRVDTVIGGVNVLAVACPTAAISTMFALKYDKNAGYSAEIFAATTLLSILTLPLILMAYEYIMKVVYIM